MTGSQRGVPRFTFGRQLCGALEEAVSREWLVADGLGGYAMGTVAGLRTRRYHGLQVVATGPPGGRRLGLAALDPTLVVGDLRIRLATHEWASGAVDPEGYLHLESFALEGGVPRWRFALGELVLERELATLHGRPVVGVVHRLVRAPGPVRLELSALCTWRDVHGERFGDGAPALELTGDGFVFEGAYRTRGPSFEPRGEWYRGVHYREEAARGLADREDLFHAGVFTAALEPGEAVGVVAWADAGVPPPEAEAIVAAARRRARAVVRRCEPDDDVDRVLALAADQLVVAGPEVVAGYPWFESWSRDTFTSYEGLFLETGRSDEGRELLAHAGAAISEGMLQNTAGEYNTIDGTLWFVHALGRHVERTGEHDLAAELGGVLDGIVETHVAGARYGIGVDSDGLLRGEGERTALTWMDARIDGVPVTPRAGKPVEVNALWIEALAVVREARERRGLEPGSVTALESRARSSFVERFAHGGRLLDVVDPDDPALRPNQLLAVSLPHAPLADPAVVLACAPLLTSLGLRSLAPEEAAYRGRHRGDPASRDRAYHQGTVWPWLYGPYVEAALRTGVPVEGVLDGLERNLGEWGLGSVSETADGDPPHAATGCPFQAWSVAELLRARRLLSGRTSIGWSERHA